MGLVETFLDTNTNLLKHSAKTLARAAEEQRFEQIYARFPDKRAEELFFQAYLAVREMEVRELKLLHEIAVLEQLLQREQSARQKEREIVRQLQEQERGNGKKTVLLSPEMLEEQEKVVNKDRKRAQEGTVELLDLFLAQHQTLVQAGKAFKTLDATFVLVDPDADRKLLRLYGQVGGTKTTLLKRFQDDVDGPKPAKLAEALEESRRKLRQHMTQFSHARREFAAFLHRHLPVVKAL